MNLSRRASVPQAPQGRIVRGQEREAGIAHYCTGGGGQFRSPMGLLASIVAYLSVVAAIVIGFLFSADALVQHSHHVTNPRPEITTAAKAGSLKAKKTAKPSRKTAEQRAIPQKSTVTAYRRKTELSNSREPHKRTVHEAHRRYWPLYRDRTAAPRALGYAEEPRFSGDPWR